MKKVIRQSVFETNSSSTHAVTIKRKNADEKWRTAEEIANVNTDEDLTCGEEREVRSAYEKMMLVWGIICEEDFEVLGNEDFEDEDPEIVEEMKEIREETKANHEQFKNILLEECAKVAEFDKAETLTEMDDCTAHAYNHRLCCRFFNEDVLDCCTCCMSFSKIAKFLGVDPEDTGAENEREFAKRLFAEEIYFVVKEGFFGGSWYINHNIF